MLDLIFTFVFCMPYLAMLVMVRPAEKEIYMDGYLKELIDHFKKAVSDKNTSAVLVIDGRSGMGKSTLAFQIAHYWDALRFNLSCVHFSPEAFNEGLANTPKDGVIIFDEGNYLSSRGAMSALNKMVVHAMSMIRSKNILVIFCINSIFDLDRNLALSRADLLLHVYGDNLTDRGNFSAFFKAKSQEDRIKQLYLMGKKFYSYSKPKANFYGRFSKEFILDPAEYELKKQDSVNAFLKGEVTDIKKHNLVEAKLIQYLKLKCNLSNNEIAEIAGVSLRTIFNKLRMIENE